MSKWKFVDPELTPSLKAIADDMERSRLEIERLRLSKLKQFSAAFVAEVGSAEASKYMLVETWDDGQVTWQFMPRPPVH